MLIDRRLAPAVNDIVTIKLLSGEEVVGKLVAQSISSVSLTKPINVTMQPVSQRQMGVGFVPLLASVEGESTFEFPLSALSVKPVKTTGDVLNKYIEMTSGIVPAPASTLLNQ